MTNPIGFWRACALAILMTSTFGCATIVKGSNQKIPVASEPSSADILVDGNLVGQTPTSIQLKRKQDHLVTIRKEGYESKSVAVVKDIGGAVWGNILAGGLIGWGVDASTGAQYNLVPQTISLKLDPLTLVRTPAAGDGQTEFVTKLKALDELHDGKRISDEEYGRGRGDLFKQYMPELISKDATAKE